MFNTDLRYTL